MVAKGVFKSGGEAESAEAYVPKGVPLTLGLLKEASQGCRGCDLFRHATQTVFGEGPGMDGPAPGAGRGGGDRARGPRIDCVFVGEQPGDQEDLAGKPFVGPAGKVFDAALAEAGIDRTRTYVTNAVKHFKFELRGQRRIHGKPSTTQVKACRPWLAHEIETIAPSLLVLMGATAAQAVMGPAFRVTQERGHVLPPPPDTPWAHAGSVFATVHPSSILRQPDEASRERAYRDFVVDMKAVALALNEIEGNPTPRPDPNRRATKPTPPTDTLFT